MVRNWGHYQLRNLDRIPIFRHDLESDFATASVISLGGSKVGLVKYFAAICKDLHYRKSILWTRADWISISVVS